MTAVEVTLYPELYLVGAIACLADCTCHVDTERIDAIAGQPAGSGKIRRPPDIYVKRTAAILNDLEYSGRGGRRIDQPQCDDQRERCTSDDIQFTGRSVAGGLYFSGPPRARVR